MKAKKTSSNGTMQNHTSSPSRDEIAREAYRLYEENGRQEGRDLEYWLAAEKALGHPRDEESLTPMEFAKTKDSHSGDERHTGGKSRKNSATREEIRQLNTPTRNSPGNTPRQSQLPQQHSA
jgi:hypothetical protein